MRMLAGIEGRGTEFHCVIGTGPADVRVSAAFPTTGPDETMARVTGYLREQQSLLGPIAAVGIACFGPLDLRPGSHRYGSLISPRRSGWPGFDLVGAVRRELPVPVVVDTDVNAAALAERAVGAGAGRDQLAFVIIGSATGIGAGVLVGGVPVHGRSHPEMGHLPVARHPDDRFAGWCTYHQDCLEGMAAGAAIAERGEPDGDQLQAWYLAQLTTALTYAYSPELIVVEGAGLDRPGLLTALRTETAARLGADPAVAAVVESIDTYLVRSALGGRAAVLGALALAHGITYSERRLFYVDHD